MNSVKNDPILQSIRVENFRCLQKLTIDTLARVNLIAGKNSVGKTGLLEAIFLLIGAENLELILKLSHFRGIKELKGEVLSILELLWAPLFFEFEVDRTIRIAAQLNSGNMQKVELVVSPASAQTLNIGGPYEPNSVLRSSLGSRRVLKQTYVSATGYSTTFEMKFVQGELRVEPVPADPPFPGFFLTARSSPSPEETANLFGRLIRAKQVAQLDLVNILKIVEPRLLQLDVVPSAGSSMIYGDIGLNQLLPLSFMGDGMSRIMAILLRIANASGGIVLIDEIENGLHYSVLEDVWRVIDTAARAFNTQVIATTHSYECIREAHSAFCRSEDYGFRLHRLDRLDNRVEAVTYDQHALEAAIRAEFEVR